LVVATNDEDRADLGASRLIALVPDAVTSNVLSEAPLTRNPAAIYLAGLDEGSRRTMRQALNTLAALLGVAPQQDGADNTMPYLACPWGELRYPHTTALRAALAQRYAPATANKMLAALRRVLQEAWRLGLLSAEDYARARDLRPITGETLPVGRALSGGELAALLATCAADRRPAGVRDAALIATLYSTLVRRSEVVSFTLDDFDAEEGTLRVRHGKGRKARLTYLAPGARAAIDAWLAVRGTEAGPLFLPLTKSGKAMLRPMRPQAVAEVLARRAAQASVAACSPHDLRRSGIGDLLDAGADIATVQQLAGHADPATTARYDRRGERAKRRAAHLLHIPYVTPAAPATSPAGTRSRAGGADDTVDSAELKRGT
jgi:site-specific recombinase XerD